MTCRDLANSRVFSPVLALALLAACSSDDGSSGSESDSATATNATNPTTTSPSTSGSASDSATTDNSGSGTDSATSDSSGSTTSASSTSTTSGGGETTTSGGSTTDSTSTGQVTLTEPQPECVQDADCPEGQICLDGMCMPPPPECQQDADCQDGYYCDAGFCKEKCKPGDEMMMGMVEKSYIWIPSMNLGDVSKIDTLTMNELARYRTGPNGGTESPSRTAVSADGRFVVVNGRGTGRTTMFAANKEDCVDKNNDGIITTSQNKGDLLAWGADECMIWTVVHPTWSGAYVGGPRGVTWTVGDWDDSPDVCAWVNPKVWLGFTSNTPGTAHLVRLDGLTGVVEETIAVPNWNGSGYAPYGGALDPQQRPWFGALRGEIVRVNTDQNPITVDRFTPPGNFQSYGFTVDMDGNPWMAGCSGPVSTFDVQSQQWISIAGTSACHRGIAVDQDMHVWVASNGPCGLVEIDGITRTLIAKHTLPQCSTAIGPSVDVENNVWLVDQGGWAWKITDKNVPAAKKVDVAGSHYVYSDMTGGQVRGVVPM
ncbi:MAG: lyase [Myxococcales bacterium]|nr:lyase [Myxococcales bacterium]